MVTRSEMLSANVLIVDDDYTEIALLERMLAGAGYTSVVSTMDPREVCDLHRARRFDLILLDLEMPGMDGFEVLDGLREIEADNYVPVVVITAEPDHKLRALQAGAKTFISKPFQLTEVLTHIKNMLEVRLLHTRARNDTRVLEATVRKVEANGAIIRRQSEELTALYHQVLAEQKLSERLMLSVLPGSAADRLRAHPDVVADHHADVTVLVADVTGFAELVSTPGSDVIERVLTRLFREFEHVGAEHGLETSWTLGDAFMATAGMANAKDGHAERAVALGFALVGVLQEFRHRTTTRLHVRVGISSGPVASGVVGTRRYIYDLWGDTVNVARRLEASGVRDRVVVSEGTKALLATSVLGDRRTEVTGAGGSAQTSWVLAQRGGA